MVGTVAGSGEARDNNLVVHGAPVSLVDQACDFCAVDRLPLDQGLSNCRQAALVLPEEPQGA
jgi:hypothetical protein